MRSGATVLPVAPCLLNVSRGFTACLKPLFAPTVFSAKCGTPPLRKRLWAGERRSATEPLRSTHKPTGCKVRAAERATLRRQCTAYKTTIIILNFCLAPRRAQELGCDTGGAHNCAKLKFSTRQGCVISVEDTHGLYGDKDSRDFAEKHRLNAQQRQGRDCGAACSHRAPYGK